MTQWVYCFKFTFIDNFLFIFYDARVHRRIIQSKNSLKSKYDILQIFLSLHTLFSQFLNLIQFLFHSFYMKPLFLFFLFMQSSLRFFFCVFLCRRLSEQKTFYTLSVPLGRKRSSLSLSLRVQIFAVSAFQGNIELDLKEKKSACSRALAGKLLQTIITLASWKSRPLLREACVSFLAIPRKGARNAANKITIRKLL